MGVVHGEVSVTVGIHDSLIRMVDRQVLAIYPTGLVILAPAIFEEMGTFVDKRSSLGIRTLVVEPRDEWADVDDSVSIGNWSRDFSVINVHHDWIIYARTQANHSRYSKLQT